MTIFFLLITKQNILHLASLEGVGGETLQSMLSYLKSGRQHLILLREGVNDKVMKNCTLE